MHNATDRRSMKVFVGSAKWPERRPTSKRTCPPPCPTNFATAASRLRAGCSLLPQLESAGFT